MNTKAIQIIAQVIEDSGFAAMSQQYKDCPEYRDKIEKAMRKNITNEHGIESSAKFSQMVRLAHTTI